MNLPITAGRRDLKPAQGPGGSKAGSAEQERRVPERFGEAQRCPEETGEGQGGRAATARQDGGDPCGRGERRHL